MSGGFDLIRAAYSVVGLDEHERAVIVLLAFMADSDGSAWPSINYLVEKTGKSERTVQRAIKRLEAAGHVRRRQRRHATAVYTLQLAARDSAKPVTVTGVSVTSVSVTSVSATPVTDVVKTRQPDTLIAKNHQSSSDASHPQKRVRGAAVAEILPALPLGASEAQWSDYDAMRQMARGSKPRPWSPAAARKARTKLLELAEQGEDPGAVLDQSVFEGWQGLFPVKASDRASGDLKSRTVDAAARWLDRRSAAGPSIATAQDWLAGDEPRNPMVRALLRREARERSGN